MSTRFRLRRKRFSSLLATFLLAGLVVSAGLIIPPQPASAAVANWQKGANVGPTSNGDFGSGSFQQSLRNLAATGANYVALDIPLYQTNVNTIDVQAGWNTPTDQALASGITYAHSLGLHVMLKFEVFPNDNQWSAFINPTDRDGWFRNYQTVLDHYISIAQTNHVEELCIGTELIEMSTDWANGTNAAHWHALITHVRGEFSGQLTYDANWGQSHFANEKDNISFWDTLDFIGISAYFNLSGDGSVTQLMQSWDSWNTSEIKPLSQRWGKPVLFTEVGYKTTSDAYQHPWMWWEGGSADQQAQANAYQALFQYWDNQSFMQGVMMWDWSSNPNAGGQGNIDYTPQHKLAQTIMTNWFSQGGGGGNAAFSASATATPQNPNVGQQTAFTLTLTDTGNGGVANANIDAEIYDANNHRVFQQVFGGQNFQSGDRKVYNFNWTPQNEGNYVVKAGVFSGDWGQNYFWSNNVLGLSVGGGGGGNGSTTVQIWWPTDNAHVNGIQPFKAMVTNMSVNDYKMYWQVDGGTLNLMHVSNVDYPHMEADVDVSPWNWHGMGPYNINFVAQDLGGHPIDQKAINIYN